MATEEELTDLRIRVANRITDIAKQDVEKAALRQELGGVNFSTALPVIERVQGLFRMLDGISLDYLSQERLQSLDKTIENVANHFRQIETFSLDVENPRAQRDAITQQIQNSYDSWFATAFPIISFSIRGATDFSALEREIRNKLAETTVILADAVKLQEASSKKAEEILDSIQRAAAKAGVSKEAIFFKEEADQYDKAGTFWFRSTVAMAIATAAWGIIVLWWLHIPNDATLPQIVQQTLGKVIILSGLYYGLIWSARNYNSSRHNFVVNRHRQNALSTFETFVSAASSEDVKEAVLLQATTSIFSAQASGYTGRDSDIEQPNKIIEILRSVSSAARTS